MPDSHWRGPIAFVAFASIVAAIALWITWDLAALETRKRVEAEQAAAQYTEGAQQRIARTCAGLDARPLIECVYEESEVAHENQRAEYDLAAQEGMFRWARWMTAASALGTLVAAVGVVFVWRSLEHTREAITNDREIGEAQVRAYVGISGVRIEKRSESVEGNTTIRCLVEVKNFGQSPARDLMVWTKGAVRPNPPTEPFEKEGDLEEGGSLGLLIPVNCRVEIVVPDYAVPAIQAKEMAVYVWGHVSYIDVFGKRPRETIFKFRCTGPNYAAGIFVAHEQTKET